MLGALLMAVQGCTDQLAREADMALRIVRQAEVRAPGVLGQVVDAAVRIDLQHERRAVPVDTQIAAAEARALEREKKTGGNIAQAGIENRIADRKGRHLLEFHPLHVSMLERLSLG